MSPQVNPVRSSFNQRYLKERLIMSERIPYRQLRVFVSSTFNDMHAERGVMIGKVFPMVADYCHKRKVEFTGVDLRWGVTEEQAQQGETVAICMAEIDRCRPLFIGMIGERYGWIPDGSPISVTEQEIRYGALDAPEDTEAFFYLRDKTLSKTLCGTDKSDNIELLNELKQRIRSGRFPVMDGYTDLDRFSRQVYEDLTGAIDRILQRKQPLNALEEERENQLFLAKQNAVNVIERPEYGLQLDDCVRRGGLTLLTGEPGSGKTALMSKWILDHADDPVRYTFLYFVGSSADKGWENQGAN